MKPPNAPNPPNMTPAEMVLHYFATCKKAAVKPDAVHGLFDPTGKLIHWSTTQNDVTRQMAKLPKGHTTKVIPEVPFVRTGAELVSRAGDARRRP